MRVVQPRTDSAGSEDPIDAIAALARVAGAPAIERAAKTLAARLHRACTFVAVLADDYGSLINVLTGESTHPIVPQGTVGLVRYGKVRGSRTVVRDGGRGPAVEITIPARALPDGVCLVIGMSAETVPPRDLVPRIDAAIVQSRGSGTSPEVLRFLELASISPATVTPISLPPDQRELTKALAGIASRFEARSVEELRDQEVRRLQFRLQLHLYDQQRALECNERELQHTLDAVDACIILTEHLIEDRARLPDEDRELLQRTLRMERTKFLMKTKADAVAAFATRFDESPVRRSGLHAASVLISSAVATEEIIAWRPDVRGVADASIIAMANRLLRRTRAHLGPLMDWVPALALLDVAVIPGRRPLQMRLRPAPPMHARLGDRFRSVAGARRRAEQRGVDALLWSLDMTSRAVIDDHLRFYDTATDDIARSLTALLDQLAETVRTSATNAREAQRDGETALGLARGRIDEWLGQLRGLMARP